MRSGGCSENESLARSRCIELDVERAARNEHHTVSDRPAQQRVGVDRVAERGPEKESALGLGPGHMPVELAPKRLLEHGSLPLVSAAQLPKPALEHSAAPDLVDEPLIDGAGAQVRRLFRDLESRDERRRRRDPRDAESGSHGLRETAQINDSALAVVRLDRPRFRDGRHIVEEQRAVGVVLDDQHVARRGPGEELRAPRERHQQAGRVLEIRHHVDEGDSPARGALAQQHAVEVGDVDAGPVLLHADEVPLGIPERRHRSRVGGQLHESDISGIEKHARRTGPAPAASRS